MGSGTSKQQPTRSFGRQPSWQADDGWEPTPEPVKTLVVQQPNKNQRRRHLQTPPLLLEADTTFDQQLPETFRANETETREANFGSTFGTGDEAALLTSIGTKGSFIDEDFAPNDAALYYSNRPGSAMDFVWRSPKELCPVPLLFGNDSEKMEVFQGDLADYWFVSACAALAQQPNLLQQLVLIASGLSLGTCNIVQCRFNRFGEWITVLIDDKLPTRNGRLVYGSCGNRNQFWLPLLEKAYAKLHGSYEGMEGGQASDAFSDLTGAIVERYALQNPAQDLFRRLAKGVATGAFVSCTKQGNWSSFGEAGKEEGLGSVHGYTVVNVKRIRRINGFEALVLMKNPWGLKQTWKGAWCKSDHRWMFVDDETKKWHSNLRIAQDQFWMRYRDFVKCFYDVTICTMWRNTPCQRMAYGHWLPSSAGGSRNDMNAFVTNPQFLLTIFESDDKDLTVLKGEKPARTCSTVISLTQDHRSTSRFQRVKLLHIAFFIYQCQNQGRLSLDTFKHSQEFVKSGKFINSRQVVSRLELPPGFYMIIPCAFEKGQLGSFLLRTSANKNVDLKPMQDYDPSNDVSIKLQETEAELLPPKIVDFTTKLMPSQYMQQWDSEDYEPEILNIMTPDDFYRPPTVTDEAKK